MFLGYSTIFSGFSGLPAIFVPEVWMHGKIQNIGDHVVIMGVPGVGKTAPTLMLQEEGGYAVINSHDTVVKSAGESVKKISDAGDLWSDQTVIPAIFNHVSALPWEQGKCFDGFPRSLRQAQVLYSFTQYLSGKLIVIEICAPIEVVVGRIKKRRDLAEKEQGEKNKGPRPDDDLDTHAGRVQKYEAYAPPILNYYRGLPDVPVHRVNGDRPMKEVCDEIRDLVLVKVPA